MTERLHPSQVRLTPHPTADGWSHISMSSHAWRSPEVLEVVALLRRRGLVPRLHPVSLSAREVYAALSNNPVAECRALVLKGRTVKRGDEHSPRSILTVPGRVEVLARCPMVAAVVAAAHTTRRPMVALSALAGRLLMEGRAVIQVIE